MLHKSSALCHPTHPEDLEYEDNDYDAHDHQTDEGPIGEYVDNV